jgi:hypothetical protein
MKPSVLGRCAFRYCAAVAMLGGCGGGIAGGIVPSAKLSGQKTFHYTGNEQEEGYCAGGSGVGGAGAALSSRARLCEGAAVPAAVVAPLAPLSSRTRRRKCIKPVK